MILNDRMEQKRKSFMDLFEGGGKISTYNLFYMMHRTGKYQSPDPLVLLRDVELELRRSLKRYENDRRRELLRVVTENPREALDYAEYIIWYLGLPDKERDELKHVRWEAIKSTLPPTVKQLSFLQDLGYQGDVSAIKSKREASDLIEEMILENSRKGFGER